MSFLKGLSKAGRRGARSAGRSARRGSRSAGRYARRSARSAGRHARRGSRSAGRYASRGARSAGRQARRGVRRGGQALKSAGRRLSAQARQLVPELLSDPNIQMALVTGDQEAVKAAIMDTVYQKYPHYAPMMQMILPMVMSQMAMGGPRLPPGGYGMQPGLEPAYGEEMGYGDEYGEYNAYMNQLGGYSAGYRLQMDNKGRRSFTVKVTPELRQLLNLPPLQTTVGTFVNKKPIEAASKAYTAICRTAQSKGTGDCPELLIIILDLKNQTSRGQQKEMRYWVSRQDNPRQVNYSKSGRSVNYRWKYNIIPVKYRSDKEQSATLKKRRSVIAKAKWDNPAKVYKDNAKNRRLGRVGQPYKKPTRYSPK